jgi:hypothetical protein
MSERLPLRLSCLLHELQAAGFTSTPLEEFSRARQQFLRSCWVWISAHPQPDTIKDEIVATLSAIRQLLMLSGTLTGGAP